MAYPLKRVLFNLPSWLDASHRLFGVSWIPVGSVSGGSSDEDAYRTFEQDPQPLAYEPFFDPLQANPNRVRVDMNESGPVFLHGWRPFAELTEANTSPTTLMDHDTLIAGALAECHRKIQSRLAHIDPASSAWHDREAGRQESKFQDLLKTHDYGNAMPETKEVLPRRVYVRLS